MIKKGTHKLERDKNSNINFQVDLFSNKIVLFKLKIQLNK